MPRPKPTFTERFQVSCEVEATQLGSVVAHFTKMGLPNIHFELITDIRTFRNNTRKDQTTLIAPNNGTAQDILLPWVKEHPTFKAIEAANYLAANGSTKAATYYALRMLVEKKILKNLGEGNYARTDVKQLTAPKKHAAKKSAKPAKKRVVHDITHYDAILRLARRNHGRVTFENIKKHFKDEGRNVASVHPAIGELVEKKLVKRNETGIELVTTKTSAAEAKTQDIAIEAPHG